MINVPSAYPTDEVTVVLQCAQGVFTGDAECKLHSHLIVSYYAQRQGMSATPVPVPKEFFALCPHAQGKTLAISWLLIAQIVIGLLQAIVNALLNPPTPTPTPTPTP